MAAGIASITARTLVRSHSPFLAPTCPCCSKQQAASDEVLQAAQEKLQQAEAALADAAAKEQAAEAALAAAQQRETAAEERIAAAEARAAAAEEEAARWECGRFHQGRAQAARSHPATRC